MRVGLGEEACSGVIAPRILTLLFVSLAILSGMLGASTARAQMPPIVVSQTSWLATLPSGVFDNANAAGTTFAVNASGEIGVGDTYGNAVFLINGLTGSVEKQWSYQNPGAVTMDADGNLYIASLFAGYIVKLPYKDGAYADLTIDPQTATLAACTGNDTTECLWGGNLLSSVNNGAFGIGAMTFDSKGDFFFVTDGSTWGTAGKPFSIFECSVASSCISAAGSGSGSGAPAELFSEPAATSSAECATSGATVQITPGSLAIDPWGNLFFTDSALNTCGISEYSDLNELAVNPDGTYANTPVELYRLMPSPPSSYNQIDSVAVDTNGTVYFGIEFGGIFGFANRGVPFTGSVPTQGIYGVWTYGAWQTGPSALTLDGKGNLYVVSPLNGGSGFTDTVGLVSVNNIPFPSSPIATAVSPTVPPQVLSAVNATNSTSVMVNDADCSTAALSFAIAENGQSSTEFAGKPGSCADSTFFPGQSSFDAALTFTPAKVGARNALLTATNTSTGESQAATAFGIGEGGMVTLDPGNPPLSYTGFTTPVGISVDAAGDLFVADAGAGIVDKIGAGSTTPGAVVSGLNTPSGTALDAAGNLYVADTGNNQIIEVPGAAGTSGTSATVVSNSTKIGATALSGPTGLALGADGVLYISDTGNNRVVTFNPASGVTSVRATGLNGPGGITVDAAGTLYVANAGTGSGGNVEIFPGGGGAVTTLTPNGVTTPIGVAVEPSGSLLVSDGPTGAIVRVPNEGGTLNSSGAVKIENNPQSGGGLALDTVGNLYTSDARGATVYAIQRTGSTIRFGSVNDGSSAQATVYAENAGNMPLALASGATSFLTQPASGNFAITAGMDNDCLAATSLGAGADCEFTAEFSPVLGVASGDLSDSADFNSTAANATAVIALNGTAVYVSAPVPGFSISLGAPSLNVRTGGSGSMAVSVTPQNGFNSAVTFSCSGLPAGTTCSFSPTTVTPSGAAATSQLTVNVASTSAKLRQDANPVLPGGAALACVVCCLFGVRRRRSMFTLLSLVLILGGLGLMSGCGTHPAPKPTSTTTTVTVNAVSGSIQSSSSFELTVQ